MSDKLRASADIRSPWTIADVLDRTDLVALLDEHSTSSGSGPGRRWHCPIPDHRDDHASVTVHVDATGHQRWRCWSGDTLHRGDAIDLIMVVRRLDRAAALDLLAARSGLRVDAPMPPAPQRVRPKPPTPQTLNPVVVEYVAACERILQSRAGRPVRDWLGRRGFDDELLRANRIGADPGRTLLRRQRGLPSGRALGATFPALDPSGAVTYVQTRYLTPDPARGKYENPASRLGRNPRLGWTVAPTPTDRDHLVVCEGLPDALTAARAGFTAVAVLGAQAPDAKAVDEIATYASDHDLGLVAVVDGDAAGRAWGTALHRHLDDRNQALRVIEPPDGRDLSEWAEGTSGWIDLVRESHPSQDGVSPPEV